MRLKLRAGASIRGGTFEWPNVRRTTSSSHRLEELNEELEALNAKAQDLEYSIAQNVAEILGI
jgi:hypothetical protein